MGNGWVAGVAASLALVLLTAVGVAALRTDTASADTVLARGSDARIALPDGTSRPAVEGERVPPGATVTTGRTGARLDTRGREVHLGGGTAVTVVDGLRQVLRRGFALVDASGDAPGAEVQTPAAAVTTADDSLARIDAGPLVRVGVLRGDAAAVRATGRRATTRVPTYFQVQVAGGGLPGAPSPYVLTPGDGYERDLATELVRADEDLTALASRLDSDGGAGAAVQAALRSDVPAGPALAPGTPTSEGTLGYLIATAARGGDVLADRYTRVRELRAAGGSWGIVAAIVEAEVGQVGAALGALLDPGTVPVLAGGPLDGAGVLGPAPAGGEPEQEPDAPTRPDVSPTRGPGDGGGDEDPQPSAPPTTGPTDPVTDLVDEVVDTVLDLVSPSPAPVLTVPLQVPLIAPTPLATLSVQLPG